jgi:hypothetical protein
MIFQIAGKIGTDLVSKLSSQILGLRVASVVFGLVCLLQLVRLLTRFEVLVSGYVMPYWPNAVALVVAGLLSYWMWWLSSRGHA